MIHQLLKGCMYGLLDGQKDSRMEMDHRSTDLGEKDDGRMDGWELEEEMVGQKDGSMDRGMDDRCISG